MDYPDVSHPLATSIENKENELGIIICGSGNGVNMSVNKHQGIRGALCWTDEISSLARTHNDANVLALPARFIDIELAKRITMTFLTTHFEGGRHQNRVDKISC
jgi:ribose 5-phosphate isomerase B